MGFCYRSEHLVKSLIALIRKSAIAFGHDLCELIKAKDILPNHDLLAHVRLRGSLGRLANRRDR